MRDAARDLREELRSGDTDRDRQPDLVEHPPPEPRRDLGRRAREPLEAAHVEERLVDREPLDERRRVLEHLEHGLARLRVRRHPRRDDDRVGAEPPRLAAAHRRPARRTPSPRSWRRAPRPPPTITGRPRSARSSRCSTAAKNASRSAWRIVARRHEHMFAWTSARGQRTRAASQPSRYASARACRAARTGAYASSGTVVSCSTPASCRSATSSTMYPPQSGPSWCSRAPTATTMHGPSPAPRIVCFVLGGQWTKSHAGADAPRPRRRGAPRRRRRGSPPGRPPSGTSPSPLPARRPDVDPELREVLVALEVAERASPPDVVPARSTCVQDVPALTRRHEPVLGRLQLASGTTSQALYAAHPYGCPRTRPDLGRRLAAAEAPSRAWFVWTAAASSSSSARTAWPTAARDPERDRYPVRHRERRARA